MILLFWLILLCLLALVGLVVVNLVIVRVVESLVPPLGRFIDVAGLRLHVWDSGEKPGQSGPPLLFIHGWLGQLNHFTYALAALFPERRVVLIDRPGAGYSQAAPDPGMAAQAAIIAKAAAALGLQKPLVIGHSLGGGIALALALANGSALSGLALIAPLTGMQDMPPSYRALARQGILARKIGAWIFGPVVTLLSAGVARDAAFAPDPMPDDFGRRGGGLLAARPGSPARRSNPKQEFLRLGAERPPDSGRRRPYAADHAAKGLRKFYSRRAGADLSLRRKKWL